MDLYDDVTKFNVSIIGIDQPTGEFKKLSPERRDWLFKVLQEEIYEYLDAVYNDDNSEQVDAMVDLIYYAIGAVVKMGVTKEQFYDVWNRVQTCNMQKKKGNKGRGSSEDAVKPEGWKKPEATL